MNRLGRRIGVDRAEVHDPRIEIVARGNFDRFFRGRAVRHEHNMILECADFYGAPGNALDHAGVLLLSHHDYVADLKRSISVKRNTGEKISQRVLERETDNDAEDG